MTTRELDLAGITDPAARGAYQTVSRILRGKAKARGAPPSVRYIFPVAKRPFFETLFTVITWVDDIVDHRDHSHAVRNLRLDEFLATFHRGVAGELPTRGELGSDDEETDALVVRAFLDLADRFDLTADDLPRFVEGQRRVLTVTEYATEEDVRAFVDTVTLIPAVWGNAILEATGPGADQYCRFATTAFQKIDFLWDLREDLDQGVLYLSLEHLAKFGLTRDELTDQLTRGHLSPALRELVAFEVARAEDNFEKAQGWVDVVHPTCRDYVRWEFAANRGKLAELAGGNYEHLITGSAATPVVKLRAAALMYRDIGKGMRADAREWFQRRRTW